MYEFGVNKMILFIDTHDSLITIALKNKEEVFIKTKESNYGHSIYVMPMIKSIFDDNKLDVKNVKKLIVVNGPGSFTGIRIGLSIAKTMAYVLNAKINTISSLMAYLVSSKLEDNKMAVIEDNNGYYVSAIDKDNKTLIEESYVEELDKKYTMVDNVIDVNRVISYVEPFESENTHFINANYIKKIGVEK